MLGLPACQDLDPVLAIKSALAGGVPTNQTGRPKATDFSVVLVAQSSFRILAPDQATKCS